MPIPPPPPGPPPPPAPQFGGGGPPINSSSSGDGRNLLLQSIRQGTKLKKAVTNDRSAPTVAGSGKSNAKTSSKVNCA